MIQCPYCLAPLQGLWKEPLTCPACRGTLFFREKSQDHFELVIQKDQGEGRTLVSLQGIRQLFSKNLTEKDFQEWEITRCPLCKAMLPLGQVGALELTPQGIWLYWPTRKAQDKICPFCKKSQASPSSWGSLTIFVEKPAQDPLEEQLESFLKTPLPKGKSGCLTLWIGLLLFILWSLP